MLKPIDTSNLLVKNVNDNGLSNDDYEMHMRKFREASRKHRYALHHVDNDFDLMEALYEEALLEYPQRLFDKDFYAERLQVAKNPEYTDKCLKSPAFKDLWDDIRHCNWNVTDDYIDRNPKLLSLYKKWVDKYTRDTGFFDAIERRILEYLYYKYNVDNEFDCILAMHDDYAEHDLSMLTSTTFYIQRMNVALMPEYTDKCFASPVFADMHDEIVARLGLK